MACTTIFRSNPWLDQLVQLGVSTDNSIVAVVVEFRSNPWLDQLVQLGVSTENTHKEECIASSSFGQHCFVQRVRRRLIGSAEVVVVVGKTHWLSGWQSLAHGPGMASSRARCPHFDWHCSSNASGLAHGHPESPTCCRW